MALLLLVSQEEWKKRKECYEPQIGDYVGNLRWSGGFQCGSHGKGKGGGRVVDAAQGTGGKGSSQARSVGCKLRGWLTQEIISSHSHSFAQSLFTTA